MPILPVEARVPVEAPLPVEAWKPVEVESPAAVGSLKAQKAITREEIDVKSVKATPPPPAGGGPTASNALVEKAQVEPPSVEKILRKLAHNLKNIRY